MELEVIEASDTLTHIVLKGHLDIAGVQEIEITFLSQTAKRGKPTLVDLSEVTYMTSIGIRMLISTANALNRAGAKLVLLKPQPMVDEMLTTMALGKVLHIVHEEEKAFELLRSK